MAAGDRKRAFGAMRAMTSFDGRPWLGEIPCPTLVVRGSEDAAVPRRHAEMLADRIPRSHLVEIEGAGHALARTHPERLAQEVERWLAGAASDAAEKQENGRQRWAG